MAALQPFPNTPGMYPLLDLLCAFGQNWNTATPSWTSIIADVRFNDGLQWQRGRQDEVGQFQPGSINGVLSSEDRKYDPSYTSSPLYPNLVPGTPFQLIAYWPTSATPIVQMVGVIEDWEQTWEIGGLAVCNFTGTDLMGALAFYNVPWYATFTLTAAARLAEIANKAGIPAGQQNFLTGPYALVPGGFGASDALSLMQKVTDGQLEYLYVSRGGTVSSHGNWAGGGLATFGGGGTAYPLHKLSSAVSGQYAYTQVQITPDSGTINGQPVGGSMVAANVGTPYTVTRYGTRVYQRNVAAMTTANGQTVATAKAAELAAKSLARPKDAVIKPAAGTASWTTVLTADFGNAYIFKAVSPVSGGTYSRVGIVQNIAHRVANGDWTVTWTNSDGSGGTAL